MFTYGPATGYQPAAEELDRKLVLLGVHACDIYGINILDEMFGGRHPDPYMDVRRAIETLENLLETGLTAEPAAGVVPRAGLAAVATEAPAGLLLYTVSFDPRGHIHTATILSPGWEY